MKMSSSSTWVVSSPTVAIPIGPQALSMRQFQKFGIYACSPEESSFTATFTDMSLTACKWPAHDGQQPDEPTQ